MLMAVSPYHLTTREAPAMAALLLAERVVTMMPTPSAHQREEDVRRATELAPGYLAFMESWSWSMPLWKAGVIAPVLAGDDPAGDVRHALERITADDRYAELRPFMRPELFDGDERSLDVISSDVLKGGPDPAISVPVAAGIDAFASRYGVCVARATPTSIAQRAEEQMGERLFAMCLPVVIQAEAERLLDARRRLAPELADLHSALRAVLDEPDDTSRADLAEAGRRYSEAFKIEHDAICTNDDPDDIRVVTAHATLTAIRLPSDAVLKSSAAAARAVGTARRRTASRAATLPARLPEAPGGVTTLLIKPLGR